MSIAPSLNLPPSSRKQTTSCSNLVSMPSSSANANTTISYTPLLSSTTTLDFPASSPSSEFPYSPLSMLYEGILADTASSFISSTSPSSRSTITSSTFPYTPLASPRFEGIHGDDSCLDFPSPSSTASSSSSSSSSGSSTVIPHSSSSCSSSPSTPSQQIDAVLAQLIGENVSRSSSRIGLLSNKEENQDTGSNASFKMTMPGGHESLIQSYNSPLLKATSCSALGLGLFHPLQEPVVAKPKRPARPNHCTNSLEDFSAFFSPFLPPPPPPPPWELGSPSLRSMRKKPKDYLKISNSSIIPSNCEKERKKAEEVQQHREAEKDDEAFADKENKRESITSIATFVSARSQSSSSPAASYEHDQQDKIPCHPHTTAPIRQNTIYHQRQQKNPKPKYPPSASRSPVPAPAPQPLALPSKEEAFGVARKPSLLRKISLTLSASKKKKSDDVVVDKNEEGGATDYAKSPRFSSQLGIETFGGVVTPFPNPELVTTVSPESDVEQRNAMDEGGGEAVGRRGLGRKLSFSRNNPASAPVPLTVKQIVGGIGSSVVVEGGLTRKLSFSRRPSNSSANGVSSSHDAIVEGARNRSPSSASFAPVHGSVRRPSITHNLPSSASSFPSSTTTQRELQRGRSTSFSHSIPFAPLTRTPSNISSIKATVGTSSHSRNRSRSTSFSQTTSSPISSSASSSSSSPSLPQLKSSLKPSSSSSFSSPSTLNHHHPDLSLRRKRSTRALIIGSATIASANANSSGNVSGRKVTFDANVQQIPPLSPTPSSASNEIQEILIETTQDTTTQKQKGIGYLTSSFRKFWK